MSELSIRDLQVSVKLPDGQLKPILFGVNLVISGLHSYAGVK